MATCLAGRILIIPGTALRRIAGVSTANGVTTVTTTYASLNEAIENGTVEWDQPIRYTPESLENAALGVAGEWVAGTAAAIDSLYWEYPVGANTLKASLEANGTTADLVFELTRNVGGGVAAVFVARATFTSQGGLDLRFFGTTLATAQDTIAGPHELTDSQNGCADSRADGPRSALPGLSFPVHRPD